MIKPPYPYFGGKARIMPQVWPHLGDTPNLVDPFLGGNAPLLSRPGWDWAAGQWADGRNRIETINDKDGFVSNFWRAIQTAPGEVARWADWPVNEADLHARHLWLVKNVDFIKRLMADPDYYDAKVAGWWVWGICQWIGGGWCKSLKQQLPHLRSAGMGVHRPSQQLPHLGGQGRGVHRPSQRRPHLGSAGMGVHRPSQDDIYGLFRALAARLRRVRVCCGDWSRVLGPTPTEHNGVTAIILDPPYSAEAGRDGDIYAQEDLGVAHEVRKWAIANGDNPKLRIALFGYEDEHAASMPDDWSCLAWKTSGGYASRAPDGNGVVNKHKERVWFSPHCLRVDELVQMGLFGE